MKIVKRILLIVAGVLATLLLVFACGRFGWKVFGFRACGGSGIESVTVEEKSVTVKGFYPGSFPAGCVGYIYRTEGDTLYFGVRYDALFGIFENGQFEAVIPVDTKINRVILRSGENEYVIYE